MALQSQLIRLLDKKAKEECGDTALSLSSTFIHQLNEHIVGNLYLAKHEIEAKVDYLAGCLTITLNNPLQELELLRARLCEGRKFNSIDDLSYIKPTTDSFPKAGRLNQEGQALFYASVAVKHDDTALRVVLSEAGAKELDMLNVLRSHQTTGSDLNLRIIGIWDQVKRDERPYYLSKDIFDYYKKARGYMVQQFDSKLLSAYELTDRFFADILSRKGSESLYQVTSALGSVFMDGNTDGVLYTSVEAKGEPVVALRPSAVDTKVEHQFVCNVLIQECYGYEFFSYETIGKTFSIERETGKINW